MTGLTAYQTLETVSRCSLITIRLWEIDVFTGSCLPMGWDVSLHTNGNGGLSQHGMGQGEGDVTGGVTIGLYTVNKWAVCILLECFLVSLINVSPLLS